MVAAVAGATGGEPLHKTCRADEAQRRGPEQPLPSNRRIVGKRNSAQVHGVSRGVEQLEPIAASGGLGHPLVEAQRGVCSQHRRRGIGRARRGGAQQLPLPAAEADGQVVHLRAILDEVHDLTVRVKKISAATIAVE